MSDEKALLAAIWEHPLDDAPRLVYADWLDEQGGEANAARAEFIRVQCELEHLPTDNPRYKTLERRQNSLVKAWKKEWLKPLVKHKRNAEFSRGFPVPLVGDLTVNGLAGLGASYFQAAPLWRYRLTVFGDDLDTLLRWPQLHRLTELSVAGRLRAGWAKRVAACEGLRNVTELRIGHGALKTSELRTILDAWAGRRLRVLLVNHSPLGDAGIELIARHPATAHLRRLYAHTTRITAVGIKAVADGRNLDRLLMATFAHNKLGATGGRHLLRWQALGGIRELYLMNTRMSQRVKELFRERLGDRVKI